MPFEDVIIEIIKKLYEGSNPLLALLIIIIFYLARRELERFDKIKIKIDGHDDDIIVVKKDIESLKNHLEVLNNEFRDLHPRKGSKR